MFFNERYCEPPVRWVLYAGTLLRRKVKMIGVTSRSNDNHNNDTGE